MSQGEAKGTPAVLERSPSPGTVVENPERLMNCGMCGHLSH